MIVSDKEKEERAKDTEETFSCTTGQQPAELLEYALSKKVEGNGFFKEKEYYLAVESYSTAIEMCPKMQENNDNMAVFYGNRAASYFNMREYDLALKDCTKSLEYKRDYLKALIRRCQTLEILEKLEEALADAKNVKQLDPCYPSIDNLIQRLDMANKERTEKLKDEALGKLKDLGNSILGNFGMSLDNFKVQQDPNTGSYSISMNNC